MKRIFSVVFLIFLLVITSLPAYAAAATNIQIKVDGVVIPSEVDPEIRNTRTMVPLRVISENLGAKVNWSDSEVTLTRGDMQVILKLNSSTAVKNGKTVLLDVKPFIKNNRTIVPLRFLAETFGCNINYRNLTVTVDTEPLFIDGVKVTALQQDLHMTMGSVVNQIKGNANIEAIYNNFVDNKGSKVEAPSDPTWSVQYGTGQYDFLDQEGNSIKRFDIYSLSQSSPEAAHEVHIYDATENQWYLFNDAAKKSMYQFIDTATKNGFLTFISNSAP